MPRLLITGGTGYLGGELRKQALEHGWDTAATYFTQTPPPTSAIAWLPLDVCEPNAVAKTFDTFQPDIVIHTAFRQNDPDLWAVTAAGARNIAHAAGIRDVRLIHMSSDVIFDGERATPYTEQDLPNPIIAYGIAKADAERFVSEQHPAATIVRTSLIYGFDPIDRHTTFVLAIADGQQDTQLFTDEYRCPIFVSDLAAALLEVAQRDMAGVINIAGSERLSRYAFGRLLAEAHGRDPDRIAHGTSAASSLRRPRNCTLNIEFATHMLHTPLRGVQDVLAAMRSSI